MEATSVHEFGNGVNSFYARISSRKKRSLDYLSVASIKKGLI